MPKLILILIGLFLSTQVINAQIKSTTESILKKACPQTGMLLTAMNGEKSNQNDLHEFPISTIENQHYVDAFIIGNYNSYNQELTDLGVKINTKIDNMATAMIPLQNLLQVLNTSTVEYIELATMVYTKLDAALKESNVDQVHDGIQLSKSYTGKGVIVGIIDRGFDYTHPTFYSNDGADYRVKRIFELDADRNTPEGFQYGNEITEEEKILLAETDNKEYQHGTQVAGIAGGSGGILHEEFSGVAYESDLVFVSMGAVVDNLDIVNTRVIDGINYIFSYAESVNKPAVINISLGYHTGPHDGTSITDQFIDKLTGPGKIIVGAAGNEGGFQFPLHLTHTFGQVEETIASFLVSPSNLNGHHFITDLWGEVGSEFSVALKIYNQATKRTEAATKFFSTSEIQSVRKSLLDDENDRTSFILGTHKDPFNNKPRITLSIDNTEQRTRNDLDLNNLQNNDYVLIEIKSNQNTIHGWCANDYRDATFSSLESIGVSGNVDNAVLKDGDNDYTIGELGGTANNIISVGSYTTKDAFQNVDDQTFDLSADFIINDIAQSSSIGPTVDDRIKPEVSAPGSIIITSYSSFYSNSNEANYVATTLNKNNRKSAFGPSAGTSMASPLVAGIVALMLEANPWLTPAEVKKFIQETATEDVFTGQTPNNSWGYGKVNAHKILERLDDSNSISLPRLTIFPNPSEGQFKIESVIEHNDLSVFDVTGQKVYQKSFNTNGMIDQRFDFTHLANGIYFVELSNDEVVQAAKLIIQK